jgi:hypothetical protein
MYSDNVDTTLSDHTLSTNLAALLESMILRRDALTGQQQQQCKPSKSNEQISREMVQNHEKPPTAKFERKTAKIAS